MVECGGEGEGGGQLGLSYHRNQTPCLQGTSLAQSAVTQGSRFVLSMECAGVLHLYGLLSLIWDDRPICFPSEDEEQMWRLFYRRSGMGRLEFKNALKLGK